MLSASRGLLIAFAIALWATTAAAECPTPPDPNDGWEVASPATGIPNSLMVWLVTGLMLTSLIWPDWILARDFSLSVCRKDRAIFELVKVT